MEFSMFLKLFFPCYITILCFNHVLFVDGSPENLNTNEAMPRAVASIYRWPKGQIPYTMATNLSPTNKNDINKVIQEIQSSSCVRFTPRKSETDYISIVKNVGCSGASGRKGGSQVVSLDCDIGTIRLVLMKVIGFERMHQRFDRDHYILVNIDNVAKDSQAYYTKNNPNGWQLLGTPYDTQSITHSYGTVGVINSKIPVLVAYDGSRIGGDSFTKTDLLNINRLYNCDSKDCWNATNCNYGLGPFNWQRENYGQIVYANHCDFYDAPNIGTSTVASHAFCRDLCLKNLNCTHFTWNVMTKVCYLKRTSNPYPLFISAISSQRNVCGYVNIRSPP